MREEKQLLLDEIEDKIGQSTSLVLLKYQNMTPNKAADFRSKVVGSGGLFQVMRKRIFIKAAAAAGIEFDLAALEGHVGVVFAYQDPVPVTKLIYEFSKENDQALEVLCGRFEGKLFTAGDVKQISNLPSRDEMRAQFLGTLEAPLSQTLAVMEALLSSIMYCLENKSQGNS